MAERPGEFGVQHLLQLPGHPLGRGGQPQCPGRRRHPRAAPVGDHPPALGPGHQPAGVAQPLQSTSHRRPFHPQLCGHRRGGNRYPLTGIQTSSQHHQHLQLGGSHRRITRSLGQHFPGENALRSYRNCVRHRHRCYRLRPPDHPQPGPPAPAMLRPGRGCPWWGGQVTRNGRPVYDSKRGQPKPMRAKGCRGPAERPPKTGQEGGGQRIMRGGWGCPLAHPVRGRGTVAHGPHSGPLRSHERWDQGTGPWCETSRKHPHGLVVGTRQGWVEAGIFAPPGGGGTEATHDPGALPPRRIPSALGWEGHHRINTGSESEVNVKLGMSSVGHPSRTVGRRAQCGPCIWGAGSMCMGPCPNSPPSEPAGGGSRGTDCRGSVGVADPPATPPPPHIHFRAAPVHIRAPHPYTSGPRTHIHPGFHPYTFRVFGGGRSRPLRSSLREFSVSRAYHPEKNPATPGGCGGR